MKLFKKLTYAFATVAVLLGLGSCDAPFNEIKLLDLNRCLEPMNLAAKVDLMPEISSLSAGMSPKMPRATC